MTQAALARNAPYASRYDLINGEFAVGSTLAQGLPAPIAIVPTTANLNATATPIYGIQPATPDTPYADVWNLLVEHRLRPRLVLQAGITGSMGIHLYGAYNANQPEPAPYTFSAPRGPYNPYEWRINYLGFGGGSTYYGGFTKLAGEVWRGLVVQMSYSFSKSIDDSAAPGTFPEGRPADPQDPFNARANRSLSAFDVQQRAVLAAQYVVPFHQRVLANWSISALVTVQTGLPFSPELGHQYVEQWRLSAPQSRRQWRAAFRSAILSALVRYGSRRRRIHHSRAVSVRQLRPRHSARPRSGDHRRIAGTNFRSMGKVEIAISCG